MPDKVQFNSNGGAPDDAQKAPQVDFEADYAAAQQFNVSDIDRTNEGKIAAEAATAPKYKIPQPEETQIEAQPTANPDDYIDMANEIGASRNDAVTSINDDLVKQALQKGEAAHQIEKYPNQN
jgi:hypothetical protein